MSLKPLPGSHFFSLYFGTEWELFQVIQSEVSQYMEQEGGAKEKYPYALKSPSSQENRNSIETPRVPQPLGIPSREVENYWNELGEQWGEEGRFFPKNVKKEIKQTSKLRQLNRHNLPSVRNWGERNEIDQIIIANYEPGGNPPDIILGSGSEIEEITSWCQQFKTHIKAGKLRDSLKIPYKK